MFDYIERVLGRTHATEQGLRFVRVFAFAAIPQVIALGSQHLTRDAVIAIVVAAAETAFRQIFPASTWAAIHHAAESVPVEIQPPAVQ